MPAAGGLAALVGLTVFASLAPAASTLTIRGAGFGHGIGMSQYGAYGYAKRGATHQQILSHYYTGTALGQAPAGSVVRVLLQSGSSPSFTSATSAGGRKLRPTTTYRVAPAAGGRVALLSPSGRRLATFATPLSVTPGPGGPVRLIGSANAGSYRGALEFRPGTLGGIVSVNAVGLEDYVLGVVAKESPASWPAAALEAQAIAARTYAITTSKGGAEGFDQYADTRSQVYGGVAAETATTNRAVTATAGRVVTYAGKPVVTYFFSTSGGRTEDNENIFGGRPAPWLRSVTDPYDSISPYHRWKTLNYTRTSAAAKLRGLVKGSFQTIDVVRRGSSPRVLAADIVGSRGTTRVTGVTLRQRFGLRDTWMTFNELSADVEGYDDGSGSPSIPGVAPTPVTPGGGAAAPKRLRMTGLVEFRKPGTTVVLQRRTKRGRWRRAGRTRLGHTRHFKIKLTRPGRYRVRVGGAIGPVLKASARRQAK